MRKQNSMEVQRRVPARRRLSGTWATFSTLIRKGSLIHSVISHMSEGRRSQVVLLDERRLDIIIQSKLFAGELLDIVASHFNIKEKEYFGLAYVDDTGHYSWLQLDKRVLENDFPKRNPSQGTLTLYFRVKYFVESITQLQDAATIEAFYLQAKSLLSKGELEVDSDTVFQLAALVLQATYGDYIDDATSKSHLKRLPVLPTSTLKEHLSISLCETRVVEHYKSLVGQTRGAAIVNYVSIVESLPTYGQHYYEVKDKNTIPCWLGLSYRGISQYDQNDRRTPRKVFLWKQLENLYFRDKKFTIEVHEARRVVHTLSSFNLYEDAIEEPVEEFDDLSNAICDPTTQVSVSRRTLAPANVTVYVWYATTPAVTKCIWSMAIAQHQFFLDRKHRRTHVSVVRSLSQIASELCRSIQSLSSASSQSNLSRSNSSTSIPIIATEGELSEESKAAKMEMLVALRARKDALEDSLKKKTEELKSLCLKEGELTGEIPPEIPLHPGEAQPQVRRRIGTSFTLSDKLIYRPKTKEKDLNDLELEYEIQSKIASAAFRLANDSASRKSVRKQRKTTYELATNKLRDIEQKLNTLKKEKDSVQKKGDRRTGERDIIEESGECFSVENKSKERNGNTERSLNNTGVAPCSSLPQIITSDCGSIPSSPAKCRQRHQSLQHIPTLLRNEYTEIGPFETCTWRTPSVYSAGSEYDTLSCGSESMLSFRAPYRNRFESGLDIEGTNLYSVPNRRASQAFDGQCDPLSNVKQNDSDSQTSLTAVESERGLQESPFSMPISSSYDERLIHKGIENFQRVLCNSPLSNKSFNASDTASLNCYNVEQSELIDESFRVHEKFNLFHSENSLYRNKEDALSLQLDHTHISEPNLTNPVSEMIRKSTCTGSLLRVSMRNKSLSKSPYGTEVYGGIKNQSISQVADLVQASMILQDGKKTACVSVLDQNVPKVKTKEWIETSLDSPYVVRKNKKINESVGSEFPTNELRCTTPQESFQYVANDCDSVGLPLHTSFESFKFAQNCNADINFQNSSEVLTNSNGINLPSSFQYGPQGYKDTGLHFDQLPYSTPVEQNKSPLYSNERCQSDSFGSIPKSDTRKLYISGSFSSQHKFSDCYSLQQHSDSSNYSELENLYSNPPITANNLHQMTSDKPSPKEHLNHNVFTSHHNCNEGLAHDINVNTDLSENKFIFDPLEHQCYANGEVPVNCSALYSEYCEDQINLNVQPLETTNRCLNAESLVSSAATSIQQSSVTLSAPMPPIFTYPANVEVNVVSVGHFQPYWEETKPYELADFYKYSTKHRKPQQKLEHHQEVISLDETAASSLYANAHCESANFTCSPGSAYCNNMEKVENKTKRQVADGMNAQTCVHGIQVEEPHNPKNTATNQYKHGEAASLYEEILLTSPVHEDTHYTLCDPSTSTSLADAFHEEMLAWYEDHDSVKKATLV